jgi:hypothetical protein
LESTVRYLLFIAVLLLGACQSTHDLLLARGYPPPYADGYRDGCGSGRQAAGRITGEFRKDVPRYLATPVYATGWNDGFRQCQTQVESEARDQALARIGSDRDRQWEQDKNQAMGRALRRR